jgi:hypothetical protein
MSEQYVGELSNTTDFVENPDEESNRKVLNLETPDDKAPIGDAFPHDAPVDVNAGTTVALLNPEDSERFRTIWMGLQGKFVDEPRVAVQEADSLVSEVIEQLTQMFAHEHSALESKWNQGNDVSTEDLRQALLRYHSFFNRLVI